MLDYEILVIFTVSLNICILLGYGTKTKEKNLKGINITDLKRKDKIEQESSQNESQGKE